MGTKATNLEKVTNSNVEPDVLTLAVMGVRIQTFTDTDNKENKVRKAFLTLSSKFKTMTQNDDGFYVETESNKLEDYYFYIKEALLKSSLKMSIFVSTPLDVVLSVIFKQKEMLDVVLQQDIDNKLQTMLSRILIGSKILLKNVFCPAGTIEDNGLPSERDKWKKTIVGVEFSKYAKSIIDEVVPYDVDDTTPLDC